MKLLFSLILSALIFTGCIHGSASVPVETVKRVAAADFECSETKINVRKITDNNWKASGCGKKQDYVCTGSNTLTDGSCFKM